MRALYRLIYPFWRSLPLDVSMRQEIQRRLFAALPFLFRNHPAFGSSDVGAWCPSWALNPTNDGAVVRREYVPRLRAEPLARKPAQILAFYLPQFHPIPENDAWWGEGFTEWTNVVRGVARFPGHYQPHLPGDLGFYDLRDTTVLKKQIELARLYGIFGFVFYFYWFGGKRLLEAPLLTYLGDSRLDFPFCLCWANESWTRRWDGRDKDVLLAQDHSPNDDFRFVAYVAKYLRDPRYLRVRGRPLLIVYRPELLPDPKATAKRWRNWCQSNGIGDLYLAYTQSFESRPPAEYGMDAALEFPPNNSGAPDITNQVPDIDPDFSGAVLDWSVFPQRSREYTDPGYTIFRGVATTWDNEARRAGSGAVFVGASPEGYREWLENALEDTVHRFSEPTERLISVNAWNEWAEGAHLEPDRRYGYAFLQATRDALERSASGVKVPILLVVHDAQRNGAQLLALHLARALNYEFRYRVYVLLLGEGPLLTDFRRVAQVSVLRSSSSLKTKAGRVARALWSSGVREAIVNSAASGAIVPRLREAGIKVVSLVHELPGLLAKSKLQIQAQMISDVADRIVFPSRQTLDGFRRFVPVPESKVCIRPQGLYKRCQATADGMEKARRDLRARYGLGAHVRVVLGVGYGDRRKGFDLFVQACCRTAKLSEQVVFIWVGNVESALAQQAVRLIENTACDSKLVLAGYQKHNAEYFLGADVFAMTSREDPFPSVVLEAFDAGLPVVAFDGAIGTAEIANEAMRLVPRFDIDAYSAAIILALQADDSQKRNTANQARSLVAREFGFRRYVWDLLALFPRSRPRVSSLIFIKANRTSTLEDCLRAILRQSLPIYELIVVANISTEGALNSLSCLISNLDPEAQLLPTRAVDGDPLNSLSHAAQLARGDLVWVVDPRIIAESTLVHTATLNMSEQNHTSSLHSLDLTGSLTSRLRDLVDTHVSGCKQRPGVSSDVGEETSLAADHPIIVPRECLVETLKRRFSGPEK